MVVRLLTLSLLVGLLLLLPSRVVHTTNLPPGFVETSVGGAWEQVVGMTFDQGGRMFVWERKGRVWLVEDGVRHEHPFLDISEEVGGWRDYGLLGFALHPDFEHTGHVYLLYVVDRHHLLHAGTSSYDAKTDEYFSATIGRITRYTAELPPGEDHYDHAHGVDYASRRVLLGESIDTGFPILHQSHGIGTLVFGTDGTLLASCGDGASYSSVDTGGSTGAGSYYAQALSDGIIDAREDVGAYRSQLLSSLNGKVIRLDPNTGNGIQSNPFFDPDAPRSARSRTWALGLRNPFRMCLRPGTGSHFASAGDPGVLYIGDVGWSTWEELNIASKPGQNFGWPAFEGMTRHDGYWNRNVQNLDAPNPLHGQSGCDQPFLFFRDLIQQETLASPPSFPNPCNQAEELPTTLDRFVHTRPALDWRHGSDRTRVGLFAGASATISELGDPNCPVSGAAFRGNCAVGGTWYNAPDFPVSYQGTYFQADYGGKWIRAFRFDDNDKPTEVSEFLTDAGGVVAIATCPKDGCLYYIRWASEIRKVAYVSSGNQAPLAVATSDLGYGPAPLAVQLVGSGSSDPDGDALDYVWDFGDGSPTSSLPNPNHVFDAPAGVPTPYTVTLTVRDSGGLSAKTTLLVSINNTPPQVEITSVPDTTQYSLDGGDQVYDLAATIVDAEHGPSERTCAWQTHLHHNAHSHAEPVDTNCTTTTTISPIGCDGETYYYRVVLTVTDAAGLSGSDEVLFVPDCGGFSGDFEGDIAGWTATGLWHRVVDGGPCGDRRGGSYSMYYGVESACTYDVGTTTGSLTSPPVDVGTLSSPTLSFHHRYETESFTGGAFDKVVVEINDGTGWAVLQQWDSRNPNVDTWTLQEYDLSSYRGKTVRVRFRFDSVDSQFNDFGGWYVDDVLFTGISDVPQPPKAEFRGAPLRGAGPLTVTFTDASANNPTAWAWDFDSDGRVDSVAQNPEHTYSAPGTYTVRLAVTNELGSSIETKSGYVFVAPEAHDWNDDVESGTGDWSATGLWARQVGPDPCGVGAFSGTASWRFGQGGACSYDSGGRSTGTLTSPELLLATGPSSLIFFHRFETETFAGPFDRCLVEINSGSGWQILTEWNSADANIESWSPTTLDLSAHAGKSVQIRFRFDSVDELFNDHEGWSIDDVTVTNVLSP